MKRILIFVGVYCFVLTGCLDLSSDTSRELVVQSVLSSPKNNFVATSYLEMGGGAAGWCYKYVNIRKNDEAFDADKKVFTTRCSGEVEVNWTTENNLSISYSDEALFNSETKWQDVEITYYSKNSKNKL